MILDNPPNQIAWRGALSSSKRLKLLEDHFREVHCSLHNNQLSHFSLGNFLGSVKRLARRDNLAPPGNRSLTRAALIGYCSMTH
jgi:hypothetical protein